VDINSLYESNMIAIPQKEQALAWMIGEGPLVEEPGLPMPALRSLVAQQRIVRLRRGLYLAPTPDGRLPSFPRTVNLVDPEGYISGQGALSLHGFNDQDISRWYSVGPSHRGDITYGQYKAHFVESPERSQDASRTQVEVRSEPVVVATPARAMIDDVDLMPFGLDVVEVARALRYTVGSGAVSEDDLMAEWRRTPSVAAARRLGLLLEIVTGERSRAFLEVARSRGGVTRLQGDTVAEPAWRLLLPRSREDIARASR